MDVRALFARPARGMIKRQYMIKQHMIKPLQSNRYNVMLQSNRYNVMLQSNRYKVTVTM